MKIAITGKMCSGKTYITEQLIKEFGFTKFSFGEKVKDIAKTLFTMQGKDRLLLQNVADKIKEIDHDVWAKYTLAQIGDNDNVIIDDLRFENEHKYLRQQKFIIIRLIVDENIRLDRLKHKYPNTYNEHISGFSHNSEQDILNLDVDLEIISNDFALENIKYFLNCLE